MGGRLDGPVSVSGEGDAAAAAVPMVDERSRHDAVAKGDERDRGAVRLACLHLRDAGAEPADDDNMLGVASPAPRVSSLLLIA